jgi:hypothetical protein
MRVELVEIKNGRRTVYFPSFETIQDSDHMIQALFYDRSPGVTFNTVVVFVLISYEKK